MNIREGARRIQYVGRLALSLAAAAFVLLILGFLIVHYTDAALSRPRHPIDFPVAAVLVLLCVYPAIFGTLFLITGWIVEGFAQPPHETTAREQSGD